MFQKFKHEEDLNSDEFNLNNNRNLIERLSDGIILHRGKQFGISLGEPMIRKYNKNSFHSINELNRLLSKTNCLLMQDSLILWQQKRPVYLMHNRKFNNMI